MVVCHPHYAHSKAMYRTFTNMERVDDDRGNGGEDDNNEHEDELGIDDLDFHEHSNPSSGMDVFFGLNIQNVDIEVDSLTRVNLIEDEIET